MPGLLVQSTSGGTSTSGVANQATGSITVTAGNSLVGWVLATTYSTPSGITDTQGNTWTYVGATPQIASAFYLFCYLVQNAAGGATVFTSGLGSANGYGIVVQEFSGLGLTGGALGSAFNSQNNIGVVGSNSLTSGNTSSISSVPALVISLCVDTNSISASRTGPTVGTTNSPTAISVPWIGSSSQSIAASEYYTLASAGTAAGTFGTTSANQYDSFGTGTIVLPVIPLVPNFALDTIKTGTTPGDATGDPARVGGTKINDALISIYSARGARATTPGCFGVSSSAGTTTTLIDATQTWATNQFAGQYVTITTGTLPSSGTATSNIAYSSLIASNTATTLTFAALPFATTLGCGYDISPVVTTAQTDGQATSVGGTAPSTLVDASKSWTTNQWAGYVVTLLGGAYAGQQAPIASNTSSALTLSTAFASAIAAGTPYVIGSGQIAASQYVTAGSTITVNPGTLWLELNGPTTMTVTFPSSPYDTQRLEISTTTAITSFATAGGTVSGAPSTMSANTGIAFRYHLGTTTWYRVQ